MSTVFELGFFVLTAASTTTTIAQYSTRKHLLIKKSVILMKWQKKEENCYSKNVNIIYRISVYARVIFEKRKTTSSQVQG